MATLLRRVIVDPVKAVAGDYKRSLEVRDTPRLHAFDAGFLYSCGSSWHMRRDYEQMGTSFHILPIGWTVLYHDCR